MLLQVLFILREILLFLLQSLYVLLVRLPLNFLASKSLQRHADSHMTEVAQAIEVIENLRSQSPNSKESAQLAHAAMLLKKSSSSGKDLSSLASAKTLEVTDTNKFTSSDWASQSFPDVSWASQTYRDSEWPIPPTSQRGIIKQEVLGSRKVQEAMTHAMKTHGWSESRARSQASKIFDEMACDMWEPVMRVVVYILRKVLRLFYPFGMNVTVEDLDRIRQTARRTPLVYLPCHKSYLDFLVVSYICFSHGLPLPHVVSGENLNIPIVGSILRYGGAFFIRRTFGNDELYKAVFNQYVTSLLVHGNTIECFIEGGRSRSGKVLPPKPGFLRVVVDAVVNQEVQDVHLVPISLGYDKIVENDNYIKELTGGEKKAERLFAFVSSSLNLIVKTMNKSVCFGQINIGFGEPISIRKCMNMESPNSPKLSGDQRKQLTKNLGYRTLYEINYSNTILLTPLVGTILLTQYGRGIQFEELITKVKWLRREVLARGGRVRQQTDEEVAASLRSVVENIMESKSSSVKKNRLVKRHKHILMLSLYSPGEQMELALHRNQLLHFFVSEGVVACAMYACERDSTTSTVAKQDLFEKAEFLSKLLRLEFVYKPSPAITEAFDQTIAYMIRRNILDEPTDDIFTINEKVANEEAGGTFIYLFLCSLFWPFIESYWLASVGLLRLAPARILDEKVLIHFVQDIGERLYFEGMIDLYEAISQETLQNALTLYESWGMIKFLEIEGQAVHTPGKRVIQLVPEYQSLEAVEGFVSKLGVYRKRVTAYRSRRFKLKKNDAVRDTLQYVKQFALSQP